MKDRIIYVETTLDGDIATYAVEEQNDPDAISLALMTTDSDEWTVPYQNVTVAESFDNGNGIMIDLHDQRVNRGVLDDSRSTQTINLDYAQLQELYLLLHHALTSPTLNAEFNIPTFKRYKEID